MDSTTLTCTAPPVVDDSQETTLSYMVVLSDAPFPELPEAELRLSLRPNPSGFRLVTTSTFVQIQVNYGQCFAVSGVSVDIFLQANFLDSVASNEIIVTVGGQPCKDISITHSQVSTCCG